VKAIHITQPIVITLPIFKKTFDGKRIVVELLLHILNKRRVGPNATSSYAEYGS